MLDFGLVGVLFGLRHAGEGVLVRAVLRESGWAVCRGSLRIGEQVGEEGLIGGGESTGGGGLSDKVFEVGQGGGAADRGEDVGVVVSEAKVEIGPIGGAGLRDKFFGRDGGRGVLARSAGECAEGEEGDLVFENKGIIVVRAGALKGVPVKGCPVEETAGPGAGKSAGLIRGEKEHGGADKTAGFERG